MLNAFAWSPEQEQTLYREWGVFSWKRGFPDVANKYFGKALDLNPNDSNALLLRSQCKRHIAQAAGGLIDAERAMNLDPLSQPKNLEACDCMYELNEFEKTTCNLENFSRKFTGKKLDAFKARLNTLGENFRDTLGNTVGHFILENEHILEKVHKIMMSTEDTRPLWKILKDGNECDVLSVLEEMVEDLKPLEVARRKRIHRVFQQIYLNRSWIDAGYLMGLQTNPDLLVEQSHLSRPILEMLTSTKYDVIRTMLKILHARCPIYTKKLRNCPNKKRKILQREQFLYIVQYRTHRIMTQVLKKMNEYKATGKLQKLRNLIEEVMGDYVVFKTHRVMPWKFEFINEVYNILGLAILNKLVEIPKKLDPDTPDRLMVLLKVNKQAELQKDLMNYEFGKRASQEEDEATEQKVMKLKAHIARLHKRIHFAKYPIEKAYLWYECARTELKQNSMDRCCSYAQKCVAEANLCNSYLWQLHGLMMMVRAHATLKKIEKIKTTLGLAIELIPNLNDRRIKYFLTQCQIQNNEDVFQKVRRFQQVSSQGSVKVKMR